MLLGRKNPKKKGRKIAYVPFLIKQTSAVTSVPIVAVAVVIVVAALPDFLQLVALALGLFTMLSVLALGFFYVAFGFMDSLFALLIIPVECPYRHSREQATDNQS